MSELSTLLSSFIPSAYGDGLPGSDAVRFAFRTTGQALFTTTATLTAGFIVFAFAGYKGVWIVGLLVTLMVVLGIIVDFLLLPLD